MDEQMMQRQAQGGGQQQPAQQGLMQQAQAQVPGEQPVPEAQGQAQAMAGGEGEQMGGEPATPEEQAQYEKVMTNAMNFLHGEQSDKIIERLGQGEQDEAAAEVAVSLVIKLYESAEAAGKPLLDAVILQAGEEILNEVVNIAVIAGVWGEMSEDEGEEIQQEALMIAMDKFGRYLEGQGRFNKEELAQGVAYAEEGGFSSQLAEPAADEEQQAAMQAEQQMMQQQGQ